MFDKLIVYVIATAFCSFAVYILVEEFADLISKRRRRAWARWRKL